MKKMKLFFLALFAALVLSLSSTSFAATLDNLMAIIVENNAQAAYDINLNAPFSKEMGGFAENINTETGEIDIGQSLIHIPGRNGLDLSLSIKYESSSAYLYNESTSAGNSTGIKGMTAYYNVFDTSGNFLRVDQQSIPSSTTITGTLTIGSEKWVFNGRYSYQGNMYNVAGMQNAAIGRPANQPSLYVLGEGWRFDIPFLTNEKGAWVIVLPSGQACLMNLLLPNGLSGYKPEDYVLSPSAETVGGVKAGYLLKHMSGMCYYFSGKGELLRIADRFGNTLDYTWSGGNLTAITDSAGRNITPPR